MRLGYMVYQVNTNPLLQQLSIPKTQARISAWNQAMNVVGTVMGQIIAAVLLEQTDYNYGMTFNTTIIAAIIAIGLYCYLLRTLKPDLVITSHFLIKLTE